MTLAPGTKLGQYEVVESIGAGGMGEVYRARDTKLGRDVAIKVLPEEFARDRERLDRFEREARLLAQLNHANIATLHGLEEHDGQQFIVMELVEGETLAERIAQGPLPVDEAIPLFIQIAEGLEVAHEKGIIHRDLKPANIKIGPDGKPKILDFGLAKAFIGEQGAVVDSSQSPTLTRGTALGAIMGTASYMSPEQARGKPIDKRTDIWAFGVCLYEALIRKKPFEGETVSDVIGAVLRAEPRLDRVPRAVRPLVRRCLQKDSRERLRDVGDARFGLIEAMHVQKSARDSERSRPASWMPWAIVALLTGAILWLVSTPGERSAEPALSRRFALTLPELFPIATVIALSPDGRYLAYVGRPYGERERVYVQDLNGGTVRDIDGTKGANYPFFSPDGRSIGFFAEGELRKVNLEGGPAQIICGIPGFFGGAWTTTGDIVFGTPSSGLFIVPDSGGAPKPLTTVPENGAVSHRWPHVLSDGDAVLFSAWNAATGESSIGWASLESGEAKEVLARGTMPIALEERYLIYARNSIIMGVELDTDSASTLSVPVPLVESVFIEVDGYVPYGVSRDGLLVYPADRSWRDASLVVVDRQGREKVLLSAPGHAYRQPAVSPDGRRLALVHYTTGGVWDLRLFDLERRTQSVISSRGGAWPVWTPDARRVVFVGTMSGQWNVLSVAADGRGAVESVTPAAEVRQIPSSYSPDGVLALERGPIGARDIWLFDASGEPSTRAFLVTEANERGARFSPDGRWIAFTSDQSGRDEVYVARASGQDAIVPISNDGGREPVWAKDMDELFYRDGTQMMSVPIAAGDDFEAGSPEVLFEGKYSYGYLDWAFNYDVSPDGSSFYMVKESEELEHRLQAVTHWIQEIETLVGAEN